MSAFNRLKNAEPTRQLSGRGSLSSGTVARSLGTQSNPPARSRDLASSCFDRFRLVRSIRELEAVYARDGAGRCVILAGDLDADGMPAGVEGSRGQNNATGGDHLRCVEVDRAT
jgi:hypothetical protein